jgi:hypothetical protein
LQGRGCEPSGLFFPHFAGNQLEMPLVWWIVTGIGAALEIGTAARLLWDFLCSL